MKLVKKSLLSALHLYAVSVLLLIALCVSASVAAQHSITQTAQASQPSSTPKPAASSKAAPTRPIPATVTPLNTPSPTTAKQTAPAAPPTSVAAVSSVAASPGTGVSSLTPSPSPPAASPPATSAGAQTAQSGGGTITSYSSSNWAGYMVSGAKYTKVSGSWTAPVPTGNGRSTTADAAWIGIGGVSSNDLIQVGTENTVTAAGQVDTAVFYELLPDAPIYPSTISVTGGDTISASITETSPGQWTVSLSDTTNGQSFTTSVSYASSYSSAEWIEEDPSFASGSLVPFDNFGSVPFSQTFATANGVSQNIASGTAGSITLVNRRGAAIATPSALGADGASFSVIHN